MKKHLKFVFDHYRPILVYFVMSSNWVSMGPYYFQEKLDFKLYKDR